MLENSNFESDSRLSEVLHPISPESAEEARLEDTAFDIDTSDAFGVYVGAELINNEEFWWNN